jgi:CP family cyanate transporter-like MFS transporter
VRRVSLLAAGLMLAGLNLRIAVASVPPLLDDLERHLGLSSSVAGLLTSLPVLCFGAGAIGAAAVARRLGGEKTLLLAFIPLCIGTALRGAGTTGALFAGTMIAAVGVALGNVVVPAVVKGRFPHRVGLLMGLYTAVVGLGAAVASGLAVPLADVLGWRGSLSVWTLPALATLVVLAVAVVRARGAVRVRPVGDARALFRDRVAWQVTLFMGIQSAMFYCGLGWLPSILQDQGFSPSSAGAWTSWFALIGIPASLIAPALATRAKDQSRLVLGLGLIQALSIGGLLALPGPAEIWVTAWGIAQGGQFALALTLIVLRTPDAQRSAELSGMTQAIGYSMGASGPVVLGVLHAMQGSWTVPLLFLLVLTLPMLYFGFGAGRARMVPPTAVAARAAG